MLMEVLHQSKHLNELAASGIAHSRFHQPAKTMNAFGEPPRKGSPRKPAALARSNRIAIRLLRSSIMERAEVVKVDSA
jgi:hypothetical protein